MNFIYVIECECIPEIDRISKPMKRFRKLNTISFFSVIKLLKTCKNLNLINIPEFWVSSSHSRPCFASDFGLHSCDLEWVQYHSTLCDLECIKFSLKNQCWNENWTTAIDSYRYAQNSWDVQSSIDLFSCVDDVDVVVLDFVADESST